MTVLEDVAGLIERISPAAICDDCIAKDLALTVRQHANHKTRELAVLRHFERVRGTCSRCQGNKLVIRYT